MEIALAQCWTKKDDIVAKSGAVRLVLIFRHSARSLRVPFSVYFLDLGYKLDCILVFTSYYWNLNYNHMEMVWTARAVHCSIRCTRLKIHECVIESIEALCGHRALSPFLRCASLTIILSWNVPLFIRLSACTNFLFFLPHLKIITLLRTNWPFYDGSL